jgi:predicted enzyme related to lactoylglutathione lyase
MPAPPDITTRFENATPILRVSNMARSIAFYTDLLGFHLEPWSDPQFGAIGRDGAGIYLCADGQGQAGTWVWIGVHDIVPIHERCLALGAEIVMAPRNFPHAREFHVRDPDGHILRFGSEPLDDAPWDDWPAGHR